MQENPNLRFNLIGMNCSLIHEQRAGPKRAYHSAVTHNSFDGCCLYCSMLTDTVARLQFIALHHTLSCGIRVRYQSTRLSIVSAFEACGDIVLPNLNGTQQDLLVRSLLNKRIKSFKIHLVILTQSQLFNCDLWGMSRSQWKLGPFGSWNINILDKTLRWWSVTWFLMIAIISLCLLLWLTHSLSFSLPVSLSFVPIYL